MTEIISWLASKNKLGKIPDHFSYLTRFPEKSVEQLFDNINLLMAKDLTDPLIQLNQQAKVSSQIADQYYFEISDHFMKFLRTKFSMTWVAAQFHSDLIYQLGRTIEKSKREKLNFL